MPLSALCMEFKHIIITVNEVWALDKIVSAMAAI